MIKELLITTSLLILLSFTIFIKYDDVHAEESIKIASIFAKTGDARAANLHHFQAVRFAINEINKQGGLLGKKVQLIEFDNHSSPIQSKLAAKKAVKAGVVAVIGASWSSHSIAMASVLQEAKIPMLTPDSTNAKVTLQGDYIFRSCYVDSFQGKVLAQFAINEFHAKTAVILTKTTSTYSIDLANIFRQYFEKQQGKILAELDYEQANDDFKKILTKIKKISPDILFIPGHDESGVIVKQAQDMGIKAILLGGGGWAYQNFFSNGGLDLKQGYFSNHWAVDLDTPESKSFLKRYRHFYEANTFAAVTYDAVMMLADAIKRANSSDRTKIRDALAKTRNFKGVTGNITIDKNGDSIKQIIILKIVDGRANYYMTIKP